MGGISFIERTKTNKKIEATYILHKQPCACFGCWTNYNTFRGRSGFRLGLDLVAIGRSLVINPKWADYAKEGNEDNITMLLDPKSAADKKIPEKLMAIVHHAKGWIKTVNG